MKNKLIYTTLILSIALLQGCSWQEYFTVNNNTNRTIKISYQIKTINRGEFAIFETQPTIYQLTRNNSINWQERIPVVDNDTSLLGISVSLPPYSVLVFGNLSNDNYFNKDQKFINGRNFNFKQMVIMQESGSIEITSTHFDRFFKKEKGNIKYDIK